MKTYEATFIFSNTMKEDVLQKVLEQIQGEITKLKGTIKEAKVLGRRQFARPMDKQESGQYARIDFQLAPDSVTAFRGKLKLNEQVFRFQIIAADEVTRNYSRRVPVQGEEGYDGLA